MDLIIKFINREKIYFNKLNNASKKLLISIIFYSLLSPIFYVFINAYLWRQSQSFQIVGLYNILFFSGVILGFFLNGFLFKKFKSPKLYILGVFLQGISTAGLLILSSINYPILITFGLIYGISTGIYWANRNLLTLKATESANRIYFASIESNSDTLLKIIIPFLIGWFIVGLNFVDPLKAYRYLAIFMLAVTILIAWQLRDFEMEIVSPSKLFLKKVSQRWQQFRIFQLTDGFFDGVMAFVPTLIVLNLVGQEDTLGRVQSISAVLAALTVFIIAKSLSSKHRIRLIVLSVFFVVFGTLIFSLIFSKIGVYILFATEAIAIPLYWLAVTSLNYDLIDEDQSHDLHYAYVVDQEIYLNCGRIIGIISFLVWAMFFGSNSALRFMPLLMGLFQITQIFLITSLDKKHS